MKTIYADKKRFIFITSANTGMMYKCSIVRITWQKSWLLSLPIPLILIIFGETNLFPDLDFEDRGPFRATLVIDPTTGESDNFHLFSGPLLESLGSTHDKAGYVWNIHFSQWIKLERASRLHHDATFVDKAEIVAAHALSDRGNTGPVESGAVLIKEGSFDGFRDAAGQFTICVDLYVFFVVHGPVLKKLGSLDLICLEKEVLLVSRDDSIAIHPVLIVVVVVVVVVVVLSVTGFNTCLGNKS